MASRGRELRALLTSKRISVMPGCWDAIGARLIEGAGFPAVYMSGLCVAASHGKPDVGLVTATEMVQHGRIIAEAVSLPVFCDADTGYGGLANVADTVRAFERAGVAGIHLEDQVVPKKCAALAGKQLVSIDEMAARLKVAQDARRDPDFVIVGRTDALAVAGLDEAIRRARAFEEAGADAVMVMSLSTPEDMRKVTAAVKVPAIVLMAETVRPLIAAAELEAMGFPAVIYPLSILLRGVAAQREILAALSKEGTTERFVSSVATINEMHRLGGIDNVVAIETKFAPAPK